MQMLMRLQPLGVDLFCFGKKFLVFNMVSRNLKIKYRRSVLGLFWTLLTPMAMAAIYYFVFKVILNIQVPNYLIFILSGVLPWTFFGQTVMEGMDALVGNLGLISKVPVPLQVFPYVGSITNLVTLGFSMPILLGAALFSNVSLGPSLIMLIFLFGALFMLAYTISLALAIAFVYFRDLKHLMGIVMQLWFYATPVIYEESMIPPKYKWILFLNPVGSIFTGIHQILGRGQWPSRNELIATAAWTIFATFATAFLHKNCGSELVERI